MDKIVEEIKINDRERKVLKVMADLYLDTGYGYCMYFRGISKETGFDEKLVRRIARSLARKGLAEYIRGLMNEDGMVAGSGYCATRKGFGLIYPKEEL